MNTLVLKIKNNSLLLSLLAMATIFIFAYSWVPGGLDVDSCNYAAVAKEAVRTHKWLQLIDPVYGGVFYYHFPLCIWVSAGLFKLFGVSTFTAKLFAMLSGVATVAVLFYFGRLLKNQWVGLFTGLSFLLTNHIIRLSRQCRMDIPVTLFVTLALMCFILAQRRGRMYYLLFGGFTCLAIFAKEVQGVAPLIIVFIYLAVRLKWKEFFHPLFISGVLVAIAPVLAWIWLDQGSLFYAWFRYNFMHLYNATSIKVRWYYYIETIVTKYAYFLPFAIYGGYLAIKEAHRNKNYEVYLLFIWVILFPLAFSFGRQKLHYFILPVYAPLAILTGFAFDRILKDAAKQKVAGSLKIILIFVSIVMLCFPIKISSKRFIETVRMSPFIDEILKQAPAYKFITHHQDKSAILFYSQQLNRVDDITDKAALEEILAKAGPEPVFCYMAASDFSGLNDSIRQGCFVLFKYRDNIFLVNQRNPQFSVTLPQ